MLLQLLPPEVIEVVIDVDCGGGGGGGRGGGEEE
jgi:hypothetical protein